MNYLDAGQHNVSNLVSTMMDAVEFNMRLDLVSKLNITPYVEGGKYHYSYGGTFGENDVVGSGDTVREAMYNFWDKFHNQKVKPQNP